MKISWLTALLVVVSSVGCSKKDSAKPETPAVAAAPDKPAAAPAATPVAGGAVKAATCPPGYKNPKPGFCITLPSGATAGTPTVYESSGEVSFSNGTTVKWHAIERYDQEAAGIESMATIHPNAKEIKRGDTPGGGKFTSWNWGGKYNIASVVKGTKWVFTCIAGDLKEDSPNIQSCQSLVGAE
jgi:hypothetical protein